MMKISELTTIIFAILYVSEAISNYRLKKMIEDDYNEMD